MLLQALRPFVPIAAFLLVADALHTPASEAAREPLRLEKYHLTLDLSFLDESQDLSSEIPGEFDTVLAGRVGEEELALLVWGYDAKEREIHEPEEVTSVARWYIEDEEEEGGYQYEGRRVLRGAYGAMPYASLIHLEQYESTRVVGETWVLGGLTTTHGYAIQIVTREAISPDLRAKIARFFEKGVVYDGELRDPQWSEEEIEERWKRDFPKRLVEEDARIRALRSKHYVIIGDSSGAKKFATIMDEHYESIRERFPFEEIEGRRLLPIFLFRDRASYIDFCVEYTGQSRVEAERSGGHFWKDYYATSYDAPGDTVHIHEATHQIFGNRLFLDGGGSWFQEGTAVYMEAVYDKSTRRDALNFADDAVKDGRYERFGPFMMKESLLQDSVGTDEKGEDLAGRAYTQAGTIMEFVLHSDTTKAKAMEYVDSVGALAPNDLPGIQRVLKRLWNVDLDGFEKLYLEYWKKPVKKL